jgi:tripartite-type tricarboxylate transporter receptor subunit TctC
LAYDPDKDFVTMGLVATSSYVLVVNPGLPVHTLQELTAYLKARPGELAFASGGAGAGQHLAGEFYKKAAQVDILHVAYKGDAAALPDLISGRVAMMFDNVGVMLPHIKSHELRPLAVASPQRSSLLPDVPTVAESGYPGFSVVGWFGLLAPSRTPSNVVNDMNAALGQVMRDPTMIKALADLGAEPKYAGVEEANAFVHEEIVRWTAFIKELGLKLN